MKELRITVSDEEGAELEHPAQALGVTLEELLKRSVAAYLPQVKAELTFQPIGFGMWRTAPRCRTPPSGSPTFGSSNGSAEGPRYRCVHRSLSGAGGRHGLYPRAPSRAARHH